MHTQQEKDYRGILSQNDPLQEEDEMRIVRKSTTRFDLPKSESSNLMMNMKLQTSTGLLKLPALTIWIWLKLHPEHALLFVRSSILANSCMRRRKKRKKPRKSNTLFRLKNCVSGLLQMITIWNSKPGMPGNFWKVETRLRQLYSFEAGICYIQNKGKLF